MANTFLTHRQMGEAEAYYKIFPNLTLKYSNVDTIFIPTDKKEYRSKFLTKVVEGDSNYSEGVQVRGGREGIFLEKPDIVDKFCRRKIPENIPALEDLSLIQFAKMYQPTRQKKKDNETDIRQSDNEECKHEEDINDKEEKLNYDNIDPWKDNEDQLSNFFITTNEKNNYVRLPKYINIQDPIPGEVPLWEKRSFPKAARIHKKRR